eukprot:6197996-Pleurochrysis_carterae.AAC.1
MRVTACAGACTRVNVRAASFDTRHSRCRARSRGSWSSSRGSDRARCARPRSSAARARTDGRARLRRQRRQRWNTEPEILANRPTAVGSHQRNGALAP